MTGRYYTIRCTNAASSDGEYEYEMASKIDTLLVHNTETPCTVPGRPNVSPSGAYICIIIEHPSHEVLMPIAFIPSPFHCEIHLRTFPPDRPIAASSFSCSSAAHPHRSYTPPRRSCSRTRWTHSGMKRCLTDWTFLSG